MSLNDVRPYQAPDETLSEDGGYLEPNEARVCFHCQRGLPAYTNITAKIAGENQAVCCSGCQSAAEFIAQNGYADFYQDRDQAQAANAANDCMPTTALFSIDDWGFSDSSSSANKVTVSVPGLYCSSCSRLLHKALSDLPFNVEAIVDFSNKQVHLEWSGTSDDFKSIINTIERLGYTVVPITQSESAAQAVFRQENETFLKRILLAGLGTMQVMTYAVAHYLGAIESADIARFLELVSMLVATIVVLYSGQLFFQNAWRDLRNRHVGMDVPVAVAIGAAFFLSVVQTLLQTEGRLLYYDSAVMFVFFLLLGRYVEARVRHRFVETEDAINRSLPSSLLVRRMTGQSTESITIRPRDVEVNDEFCLEAGDIVPCDAVIINDGVEVDESLVTGESSSLCRRNQSSLLAGTRIVSGRTVARCSHAWDDSSIAAIQRMVEQGKQKVSTNDGLINLLNRYFIVSVLSVTALVGLVWFVYQPERVFEVVLAMLIATCPCAFALADPVGTAVASNTLRRFGVVLARSDALSIIANAQHWWFDKTGTVTQGQPSIASLDTFSDLSEEHCLDLISALESDSLHPLSRAFSARVERFQATEIEEFVGKGIQGKIDGETYYAGKLSWVLENTNSSMSKPDQSESETSQYPASFIFLANHEQILARVQLRDRARSHLDMVISTLREQGIDTTLISGDNRASVTHFAEAHLFTDAYAEQTPKQKMTLLTQCSDKHGAVIMVGDGANDAPVLAAADVGIALASGSQLSLAQSDVVLLNQNLISLLVLREVAQRTKKVKQQNIGWAIAYNVAILPLAAAGLLTPWIAAIGMSLSSLGVVLNAVRIRTAPASHIVEQRS